jgi:SAM-dependent methyltransferase
MPVAMRAPVATVPNFSRREFALREWMDEPCTYAGYRRAAEDLAQINLLTLGYRPLLQFLERVVSRTRVGYEPLHIVDVGCAQGDGLRTIHQWASKRSLPLKLTGVDINPYAARLARECDRAEHVSAGTIAWVTADAFAVSLERPPDVVISSLFAHHLSDAEIVTFLRWMEDVSQVGWFVGDLRRSERAAFGFKWLTKLAGSCEMVQHDGAMSFRRALSLPEWGLRLKEAEVEGLVRDVGLGRLCVERLKS